MSGRGGIPGLPIGVIGYNVYYKSPSNFDGCLCLSYLWDVAVGICGSGFVTCPGGVESGGNEEVGTTSFLPCSEAPGFSGVALGGGSFATVNIEDRNCAEGNPQHIFTYSEAHVGGHSVVV